MLQMPGVVHSSLPLAANAFQMAKADDDFHLKRLLLHMSLRLIPQLTHAALRLSNHRLHQINLKVDRRMCNAVLIRVKRATDIRPLDIRRIPSPLFGRTFRLLENCDQSPLRSLQLYDKQSK